MGVLNNLIAYLRKTKTAFVKKNKREPNYYQIDDKRIMREEANKLMALKPIKPVLGVQNPNKKVLGLNWVRQPDIYTCGPVTINRLLKAIGIPSTIARLRILMKTSTNNKNPGTSPVNLKAGTLAFAKENKKTIQYKEVPLLSLAQIKKYIDKGIPIGAHGKTTQCMDYNGQYGHYITVTGYDMTDKKVYILDSSRGPKWIPYSCLVGFIRNRGATNPMKIITK
jgi:hypothetical protein